MTIAVEQTSLSNVLLLFVFLAWYWSMVQIDLSTGSVSYCLKYKYSLKIASREAVNLLIYFCINFHPYQLLINITLDNAPIDRFSEILHHPTKDCLGSDSIMSVYRETKFQQQKEDVSQVPQPFKSSFQV